MKKTSCIFIVFFFFVIAPIFSQEQPVYLDFSSPISWGSTPVEFSPDGSKITTGHQDGSLCVWNTTTGSLLWSAQVYQLPLGEYAWGVQAVTFSPDGNSVFAGAPRVFCMYSAETGEKIWEGFSSQDVTALAVSPDGMTLMVGDAVLGTFENFWGNFWLWDIPSQELLEAFSYHYDAGVTGVSFSPDGNWLASCDWGGKAKLFHRSNLASSRHRWESDGYVSICFSQDSHKVILGIRDIDAPQRETVLEIRSVETGEIDYTLRGYGISVSDDLQRVFVSRATGAQGSANVAKTASSFSANLLPGADIKFSYFSSDGEKIFCYDMFPPHNKRAVIIPWNYDETGINDFLLY